MLTYLAAASGRSPAHTKREIDLADVSFIIFMKCQALSTCLSWSGQRSLASSEVPFVILYTRALSITVHKWSVMQRGAAGIYKEAMHKKSRATDKKLGARSQ